MSTPNETYTAFTAEFLTTLKPEGPLEQTFASEIAGAAWRLRNCRIRESATIEPTDAEQKFIDRTRASAQLAMRRCLAELRRLQADRHSRAEKTEDGLKSGKSAPAHELGSFCKKTPEPTPEPNLGLFCKTPIPFPAPTRNRPCPCKSGVKYKKCCGRNAPTATEQAA